MARQGKRRKKPAPPPKTKYVPKLNEAERKASSGSNSGGGGNGNATGQRFRTGLKRPFKTVRAKTAEAAAKKVYRDNKSLETVTVYDSSRMPHTFDPRNWCRVNSTKFTSKADRTFRTFDADDDW